MFDNYNKSNFKNAYLLSIFLHGAIIVIYALTIIASPKTDNIINININSSSSAYVNITYQPKVQKRFENTNNLNFTPKKFNSKVEFNYAKRQNNHKKENKSQKQHKFTQQNQGTGGIANDDSTAKTIIKDQSFLNYKSPIYPKRALQQKQQGRVVVRMFLLPSGEITKVVLHKSSGYKMLDNSVLHTIRYWNGKRKVHKPAWIEIEVDFIMQ